MQNCRLRSQADEACRTAACVIGNADVLLLGTGAGFSADSGLAVYDDVARVKAYADRGLRYHDICQPTWMHENSELFWGFWGQCFNDYRNTAPHEGYEIVDRWAARRFRESPVGAAIGNFVRQSQLAVPNHAELAKVCGLWEDTGNKDDSDSGGDSQPEIAEGSKLVAVLRPPEPPYEVKDLPGGFFAFTSNVDGHHFDWFRASEIRECHGNLELFQCGKPCSRRIWRAPESFRFQVDRSTMLAPKGAAAASSQEPAPALLQDEGEDEEGDRPHIGCVRRARRRHMLRHMPYSPKAGPPQAGFEQNHPRCRRCGGAARPAVLMFGDYDWEDLEQQQDRWEDWLEAVRRVTQVGVMDAKTNTRRPLRFAVLEVGAGSNVPTVRSNSEWVARVMYTAGADIRVIRINPEQPLGDTIFFAPGGPLEDRMISIPGRALETLRRIDELIPNEDVPSQAEQQPQPQQEAPSSPEC